jgi:hypothetical protein
MKVLVLLSSGSVYETTYPNVSEMIRTAVDKTSNHVMCQEIGNGLFLMLFDFHGRDNEAARRLGMDALNSNAILFRMSGADLQWEDIAFYPLCETETNECPPRSLVTAGPNARSRTRLHRNLLKVLQKRQRQPTTMGTPPQQTGTTS